MLILLFTLIVTPAFAKSPLPAAPKTSPAQTVPAAPNVPATKKGPLLEQLHKTCLKNSFQEGKSQEAACDCLKANYEKKLSGEDLALLGRIQSGSVTKTEIEGKDELLEFDMEASQHCVEDSTWRWAPPRLP